MNKYSHIDTIIQREISRHKEWQKCKAKTGFKTQVDNELRFTRTYTYVSGQLQVNDNNTTYYFSKEIDNFIYKHLITEFMKTLEKRVAIEKTTTRELKKRLYERTVSVVASQSIDWIDEICGTKTEKTAKLVEFAKSIITAKNDTDGLNKLHKFIVVFCGSDTKKSEKMYNALVSIQVERKQANKQASKAVKAVESAYLKMIASGQTAVQATENLYMMINFGVLDATAVSTYLDDMMRKAQKVVSE